MAQSGDELAKSYRAAASVTAFRVVAPDTALSNGFIRVTHIQTETSFILGLSKDAASTDGAIAITAFGFAKGACGASVSAGSMLTFVTGTAYVVQASATSLNTTTTLIERQIGIALQNGANTDAVIEVFVNINNSMVRFA